jgi:membrane protease YdiL (CAAX protease family)
MRSTWRVIVVEPQQALLSVVLLNVVLAGLTVGSFWAGVLVARSFGRKVDFSLAPLGFTRPRGGFLAGIRVGVAVGVGAVIASIPVNLATTFVLDRLGYSTERAIQGPFMRGLFHWVQDNPDAAIPAIILVVVIFGPAVEELVFRGAIFNGLYRLGRRISGASGRRISFALAALASSVLFALLHLEPTLLPMLLILAVILCALFERTGSLLPTFVAHATFNSFAVSLIILSGLGVFELPF